MDKRIRIAGIAFAIIFAILIWVSPSNPPPIPEPTTEYGNEYVTRTIFDAVTSHPKVLYLYPNAFYAEIDVNYIDNTITLIRGHDYPPEDPVSNGFDWEFDNTHPYEYDNECFDMKLYPIRDPRSNGEEHWMTNCYPDILFYSDDEQVFNLLKAIKDL